MKKTKVNFTIKSIRGKRPINQDSLACSYNFNKEFIAVVCDGVGSVPGSEHASRLISHRFVTNWSKTGHIETPTAWFKETLKVAMEELIQYVKDFNTDAISTTLAVLMVIGDKFYCYNIGDTRIYGFQQHDLTHTVKQYTYDHNYYNYLVAQEASKDVINANEAKWHSLVNYIDPTSPKRAKFDANSGTITQKTYFLLCTDGLYAYVRDNEKYEIITRKYIPLALKLNLLNTKAIRNGSDDNVSGILVVVK
ncbi:MAG: PP2C family protein-serine/threonine phosphatase [Mycoplasmoidaceae bacterium]